MLSFEKFDNAVLHEHFIFTCIDELAETDPFLRENAALIKSEFLRTKGAYLDYLVESTANSTNEIEQLRNIQIILRINEIYNATYQKICRLYSVSFFDDGKDENRQYKYDAYNELTKLLDYKFKNKFIKTSIESRNAALLSALLSNKYSKSQYINRHSKTLEECYYPVVDTDDVECFKVLLQKKIAYTSEETGGLRRITLRAKKQVPLLQYLIDNNALECLRHFMQHLPAEINTSFEKTNALLYAIQVGNIDAAMLIVDNSDIDLNAVNGDHKNALHLAVEQGNLVLVDRLLKAGVSPYVRDKSKQTPLSLARALLPHEDAPHYATHQSIIQLFQHQIESRPDVAHALNSGHYTSPELKLMLTNGDIPHVIPDLSLFAHINTAYKMTNSKLEGNQYRHTSRYVMDILRRNRAVIPLPEEMFSKVMHTLQEIKDTDEMILSQRTGQNIPTIADEWLNKLNQNNSLYIGGGYQSAISGGHAMVFQLEKNENKIVFKIYNTGDGLSYHQASLGEQKYSGFKAYEFDYTEAGVKSLLEKILYYRICTPIENKDVSGANIYFHITGFDDWKVHTIPNFDSKSTPKTIAGNGLVLYKKVETRHGHRIELDRYALVSNGVCLIDDGNPSDIGLKPNIRRKESWDEGYDSILDKPVYKKYIDKEATEEELLASIQITHPGVLQSLDASERIDLYTQKTEIRGQISGNCSYQSLQSGLLKDMLSEEAYQHVKLIIRLQSLLDFTIERQAIGDYQSPEIRREIEDAIEKTAKFVQDKKELATLSTALSMDVLRFLETIQTYVQSDEKNIQPIRQRTKIIERTTHATLKHKRSEYGSKKKPIIWSFDPNAEVELMLIQTHAQTSLSNITELIAFSSLYEKEALATQFGDSTIGLKQSIKVVLDTIPLDRLFDSKQGDDQSHFYYIEKENIMAFIQSIQILAMRYSQKIQQDYTPGDTAQLQKMLILLEWANQRAEKIFGLTPNSFVTNKIVEHLNKLKDLNLYISTSEDEKLNGLLQNLLSGREVKAPPEPIDILGPILETNPQLVEEYLGAAISLAKLASKDNRDISKLDSLSITESEKKKLVANYLANELTKSQSTLHASVNAIIPNEMIEQCHYLKHYYSAQQALYKGLFLEDSVEPELQFCKFKMFSDRIASEDNRIVFIMPEMYLFFSERQARKIMQSWYYKDDSEKVFRDKNDFLSKLHFSENTKTSNAIQIYAAPDKGHIKHYPFRDILHTRTNNNTQFIKTIDYFFNHTDKILDPHYQRILWINLFNYNAITYAKKHQPEAFLSFIHLIQNAIKKHIDGLHIDGAVLNLWDLFSIMIGHLNEVDNPDLWVQVNNIGKQLSRLIQDHSPERRSFESLAQKQNAYAVQSRLYRISLLSLLNKSKISLNDISLYLKGQAFLGLHPCPLDMPLMKRLQDTVSHTMMTYIQQLTDDQLNEIMNSLFPEYEGNWEISELNIVNQAARINFNVITGIRTEKGNAIRSVPESALANPHFSRLFPSIDFATQINYFDDGDKHYKDYFMFELNGEHLRYHVFREAIQHAFVLDGQTNWWQHLGQCRSGNRDPEALFERLPKILRDKESDFWVDANHRGRLMITTRNGTQPNYIYQHNKIYLIENAVITDYTLLSLDNPDYLLSRLTDFENKEFILAWHSTTRHPSYKIELPRYNLSFSGEEVGTQLILTCDRYPGYKLDLTTLGDVNEPFTNYIKLVPIDADSELKPLALIPNVQFILGEEQELPRSVKYNPLTLDTNNSFHDVYENRKIHEGKDESVYTPFYHNPQHYHYTQSESYTEFELQDGKLLTKNQGDLLHAIYIYLGSNDYEKAYEALYHYIHQEGGFLTSPKEFRMFNWLLNDIPKNIFHYKDPRYDKTNKMKLNHPVLISIKLKLAIQMAKYVNSQGVINIKSEDAVFLKLKPWEMEELHGTPQNASTLSKSSLQAEVDYWLTLYARQYKNIPKHMHLTPLENTILENLRSPVQLSERLAVLPTSERVTGVLSTIVEHEKPLSLLKICESLDIGLAFDQVVLEEPSITEIFTLQQSNPSSFVLEATVRANEDYQFSFIEQLRKEAFHSHVLEHFLQVPEGTTKTNVTRLVSDVHQKNEALKLKLSNLSEELLTLANANLRRPEFRIALLAKRHKKLTMADLNRLFVQNDLVDYQHETLLTEEAISTLRKLHTEYLELKAQSAQYTHFLELTEGRTDTRENLEKIIPDIYKWYLQERVYDIQKHPEFLLFEAEEGKLILQKQYHILSNLLSTNDVGEFKSQVMQLIMGGGKSKVLLPLLALCKAKGINLSVIVVPDALLNTNFTDLARTTKRLFNQDIYHFYFNRNGDYSENALLTKLNQLKHMMVTKSFIVMNKTSLEDLELKLLELSKENIPQNKNSINLMKEILHLIRTKGDALIDEVHAVHDIRVERNFSLTGYSEKFNQYYIDINMQFSIFWRSVVFRDQDLLTYLSRPDGSFTQEEMPLVIATCLNELLNPINESNPLRNLLTLIPRHELEDFLQGKSEPEMFKALSDIEKEPAYIVKEQLTTLFPLTLSKNPLEHYGPTKREEELDTVQGGLSKPYSGADTPSEDSRFSSPFETLNYTLLYHLKYGINPHVFSAFIQSFQKQAKEERALSLHKKRITQTQAAARFTQISGLSPEWLQSDVTPFMLEELYRQCYKKRSLVTHCLQHIVLPEIEVDSLLLRHNSINHASQFRTVQGFSGTILSPYVFDSRMEAFNYDLAKGTDGETIHHIARKKTEVVKLSSANPKDILNELLSSMQENTSSLIDVGGTLKGLSNKAVAHNIARNIAEKIGTEQASAMEYVLFFNEQDQLVAIPVSEANKPSPQTILIGSTDIDVIKKKLNVQSLDKYFVYYDQSHTIGVDVTQDPNAHALVTCGNTTLLSKLLQGVMRMRSFPMNQNITLVADTQVQSDLHHKEDLNYQDILNYTFQNQLSKIAKDNVIATRYMLANVIRDHLMSNLLNSNDRRHFSLFEDILFDKQVMSACQLFAGIKTTQPTELEFSRYRDSLLNAFLQRASDLYNEEALNDILITLKGQMDVIIQRQLLGCPDTIETTSRNNYNQETTTEKDMAKEKDLDIDTNIEMDMQISVQEGDFVESPEISWESSKTAIQDNLAMDVDAITVEVASLTFKLFYKVTDCVPLDNEFSPFSDQLYLSVNQRLSDHTQTTLLHPLKKPVECVLWTPYEDPISRQLKLRATFITSTEYSYMMNNPELLPQSAWIESQLGTVIMGNKPSETSLLNDYNELKAQIAYYNGDLETLLKSKSNQKWLLDDQFENKMHYLQEHILPFYPEKRRDHWQLFERYFTEKDAKRSSHRAASSEKSSLRRKAFLQRSQFLEPPPSSLKDTTLLKKYKNERAIDSLLKDPRSKPH